MQSWIWTALRDLNGRKGEDSALFMKITRWSILVFIALLIFAYCYIGSNGFYVDLWADDAPPWSFLSWLRMGGVIAVAEIVSLVLFNRVAAWVDKMIF